MSLPKSPAWDHVLRKPTLQVPEGSCDCHFHFIGPQEMFPLRPGHVFSHLEFDDDTMEDWVELQAAMGFTRGLHVLSMMYKHGYELMIHSLGRCPERLRGVIAPARNVTDLELDMLTKAGVVGARFSYRTNTVLDETLVARTHEQGWSMHYLVRGGEETDAWRDQMLASPGNFVVEHMGLPAMDEGVDGASFRFVLDALETGRGWVKLSPRISAQETFPFSDVDPFVRRVVEQAPERLLWGSDWPHPQYFKPMPNDADLVDQIATWLPTEGLRRQVLVNNPAELFHFPALG